MLSVMMSINLTIADVIICLCCIQQDIAVKDNSFTQFKTLDQLFPAKATVFLIGKPNYGVMGEVILVKLFHISLLKFREIMLVEESRYCRFFKALC